MNSLTKHLGFMLAGIAVIFCSCKKVVISVPEDWDPWGYSLGYWTWSTQLVVAFYDSLNNQPAGTVFLTGKHSISTTKFISWKWKQLTGPTTTNIAFPDSIETTVSNLTVGSYSFELTAEDSSHWIAKDTAFVTIASLTNPGGHAVKAVNAGPDQTISLPLDSAYLDGSGSIPNGTTASANTAFRWTMISGPVAASLATTNRMGQQLGRTTALASKLVPGVYTFQLMVTASGASSVMDTMKVIVLNDPQNTNTIIYHELVWKQGGTPPASAYTTFLPTPLQPHLWDPAGVHKRNFQVSRRANGQSPWISVPFFIDKTAPYVWYGLPHTGIILTQPDNPSLVGTREDMRVKIL